MTALPLDGPHQPAASGAGDAAVILLHGLGADGRDLFGLADMIADAVPNAAIYAPHAPFACDMAPVGRQWFSMLDRSPAAIEAGVDVAAPHLDGFIDAVTADAGLAADRVALFGFSQGCMMALHVAPRRAEALGAVLGYSGALVAPHRLAAEKRAAPPIFLAHGDADPIVPFAMLAAAEAGLRAAGLAPVAMARPGLGHGLDPEGLGAGLAFLRDRLS